jgi:D-alanyl-lipoteichoic acid acyltransferase DltB (MBOAT superfamily)
LADGLSKFVGPVFLSVEAADVISTFDAWAGSLAYTFQLYFDFSGYSDMAVGLARLFGVILPINFNSPYKSTSIIEFWRRWHITLSHFLRDYLYFSLGGNRLGRKRRYLNLLLTMLLGGLWHGAGWTYVVWGALHGLALSLNHFWHEIKRGLNIQDDHKGYTFFYWLLTFLVILVFWVFFRAESIAGAFNILYAMLGLGESVERVTSTGCIYWFFGMALICLWGPNTYQIMSSYKPILTQEVLDERQNGRIIWQPNRRWASVIAIMAFWSICTLSSVTEFLYFQF